MTIDRVLAGVSVFLGVPGFVLLFAGQGYVVAGVLIGFGVVSASGLAAVVVMSKLPPFSVQHLNIVLSFTEGRKYAHIAKEYTARANHPGQQFISFRNNSSDGAFQKILWRGRVVAKSNIAVEAGDYIVHAKLNPAPKQWSTFTGTLKITVENAFDEDEEFVIYAPDFKTRRATIRIELPADKPCLSAKAAQRRGAGEVEDKDPMISDDRMVITAIINRPKLGVEYKITWTW